MEEMKINKINRIKQNQKYKEYVQRIELHEKERFFCKHDMTHFLDVCRLTQILCMKKNNPLSTELIYAAGLLHDIGRWQEYEKGVRHEIASGILAMEILEECGFDGEETEEVVLAIKNHRNKQVRLQDDLSGYLY